MPPAIEKKLTAAAVKLKRKDPKHRYAASRRKKSDRCSRWAEATTKMQKIILGFCQRLNNCWVGCYYLYRGIATESSPSKTITCGGINTKVSLLKRHLLLQSADAIKIPREKDITCDGISTIFTNAEPSADEKNSTAAAIEMKR